MKLSIIIPVYNAEKYLTKCLDSISKQNLDQDIYEVIVINDGSTDHSLKIAESFKHQIFNYIIITHSNQGEAPSRNKALKVARGEYITFLDSDDFYEDGALSYALERVARDDLDILYLRLKQVNEKGEFIGFVHDLREENNAERGVHFTRRPFPATVYGRKIIGDIIFPTGILIGPDSVFNAMVQSKAERVSFTTKAIYNYTYRSDSLSKQGQSPKAFAGFLHAIEQLYAFQQKNFAGGGGTKDYFDNVYEIFVTRILELNVMPTWSEDNYNQVIELLEEKNLLYILGRFSKKYPFVASSFTKFKMYQQYLLLKSKIHRIIYRA